VSITVDRAGDEEKNPPNPSEGGGMTDVPGWHLEGD